MFVVILCVWQENIAMRNFQYAVPIRQYSRVCLSKALKSIKTHVCVEQRLVQPGDFIATPRESPENATNNCVQIFQTQIFCVTLKDMEMESRKTENVLKQLVTKMTEKLVVNVVQEIIGSLTGVAESYARSM